MPDEPSTEPATVRVLLAVGEAAVADRTTDCLERNGVPVTTVAGAAALCDRLAEGAADCLVVDPAVLDTDVGTFVSTLQEAGPGVPVVWFPRGDTDPIDDDALAVPTTIVQQGAVADDCGFLVSKIRGLVATDSPRGADRATYRTLVESASDGLYTLDPAGRVRYLNDSFAEMLGYDRADLIGVHAATVMAPGELERGQQVVQALMADPDRDSDVMDMEMVRATGEPLTVSVHYSVLSGEDGTYEGIMGVVRDVTERKQQERELARQRDRLNEFAGVVSHDLRNPLNLADGHLELAREECDSENLEMVARAHDRMETLIDDLLSLARAGETVGDPEPVELGGVVEAAWRTVRTADADLLVDVDATVAADENRLRELFENLFRNAVDHGGEDVTVTVGAFEDGLYVADDGQGIPAEPRESVFEHGYTTSDSGTGFGLAIVQTIAQAHGWTPDVTESRAGGARFEFTGVEFLDEDAG